MSVLDISAGGGYTTRLMALAVGANGKVWAQIPKDSPSLDRRLSAHPQANIEVLQRPFEDPFPKVAPRVDLVTLVLSYHDIAYSPVDRAHMDRAILDALRPGGHLILIDHAARAGSGTADAKSLHRIDEQTVRAELVAAGFVLEAESGFLRNPKDPREQAFFRHERAGGPVRVAFREAQVNSSDPLGLGCSSLSVAGRTQRHVLFSALRFFRPLHATTDEPE